ncbi:MAG TPA: galactose-1-phosphate uridylyltransferase [Ornithinimicrobium sp.]|uniref:galactose-1-phosphate uridylyltransferase n=1 Tax=Ornithinimicrobium sp. TaxID=1977084 RepID=UPI002B49BB95|nr:galactose-1-phosphate uridylyltransferase [Ornithinimicrobium sp.]HKJ11507.1 galactose-1-phosphate uridylyltransferase [Ornithinimicrobium sp.]
MSLHAQRTHRHLADDRDLFYYDDAASPPAAGRDARDTRELPAMPAGARMRRDPLTGEWIPLASHRMNRTHMPARADCPLCPSRPEGPPSEIPASDYHVVVFENRFPSLNPREAQPSSTVDGEPVWPEHASDGRCEVVCFTSDHESRFAELSPARARTVIEAWADRSRELGERPSVHAVFAFENRGEEIGVTLAHPHGQIYAYPYLPPRSAQHLRQAGQHYERTGRDLLGDVLEAEQRSGRRVVARGEHWTAFVPAAARWPVEVHLVPHRHVLDLAETHDAERAELAWLYPRLLRALDHFFTGVDGAPIDLPYIAGWFAAPTETGAPGRREQPGSLPRLHLQVFSVMRAPGKLKYLAGSESAQGAWVSDTTPETIADRLQVVYPAAGRA